VNWKKILDNTLYIFLLVCLAIAAYLGKWLYAIVIMLLIIDRTLDQIHDTIKEAFRIKE
jgi:hypothetical protein